MGSSKLCILENKNKVLINDRKHFIMVITHFFHNTVLLTYNTRINGDFNKSSKSLDVCNIYTQIIKLQIRNVFWFFFYDLKTNLKFIREYCTARFDGCNLFPIKLLSTWYRLSACNCSITAFCICIISTNPRRYMVERNLFNERRPILSKIPPFKYLN